MKKSLLCMYTVLQTFLCAFCGQVWGQDIIWVGTNNDKWSGANNWSPNRVPTGTDNVIIPSNAVRFPVIDNSIGNQVAACKNLTLQSGARLNIDRLNNNREFEIAGNIQIDGELSMDASARPILLKGNTGIISQGSAGVLKDVKVQLISGAAYTIASNLSIHTVIINSGASLHIGNNTLNTYTFIQYGTIHLNSGTLGIAGPAVVNNQPNPVFTEATFEEGTGTVFYNSGDDYPAAIQTVPAITYYTLKIRSNKRISDAQNNVIMLGGTSAGELARIRCESLTIENPGQDGGVVVTAKPIDVTQALRIGETGSGIRFIINHEIVNPSATDASFIMGNIDEHALSIAYADPNNAAIRLGQNGSITNATFFGTVDYSTSSNNQQLILPGTYQNIRISNGTAKRVLVNSIQVNGDIDLVAGELDVQNPQNQISYAIHLKGDWTIENGIFNPRNEKVLFSGTRRQRIKSNNQSFYDIEIANTSSNGIELWDATSVRNQINLQQGFLKLNGQTLRLLNSSADAIIGGSSTSYIRSESQPGTGNIAWQIGSDKTTHVFPFGYENNTHHYIPFYFTAEPGSGDAGLVSVSTYFPMSDPESASHYKPWPPTVTNISSKNFENNAPNMVRRFWQINVTGTAPSATIRFHYAYPEDPLQGNTDMWAQRWHGQWEERLPDQTDNATERWVEVRNVTQFSPWALSTLPNPLPVTLHSFSAQLIDQQVQLDWKTAREENTSHFVVERSISDMQFTTVASIDARGESRNLVSYQVFDTKPLSGLSYYRLKMVDRDGTYTYSKLAVIHSDESVIEIIRTIPNPSDGTNVAIRADNGSPLTLLQINDLIGRRVSFLNVAQENSTLQVRFVNALPAGIYIATLQSADRTRLVYVKFVVK